MLQNVHRKSCSIQIFRPHCTFCSYCGDIPIKGEFLPKSKKLYNVYVWLFIARVYGHIIPRLLMIRLGNISSNHFQDANVRACLPLQYTESEFSSKDKE